MAHMARQNRSIYDTCNIDKKEKSLATAVVTRLFFFYIGTASGNRTRDSAVRGLRLNLLTNAAYIRVTSATRISIHNISELV